MNSYVTGAMIKKLRECKGLTQTGLAEKLFISEKTVSKWETGKGYPDIGILEELAAALGVSVIELMAGESITNQNRSFNIKRTKFYVCPVCGNIITAAGEAVISCCGITLPPLSAEAADDEHKALVSTAEDEYFIEFPHEMSKTHYISFVAALTDDTAHIVKFYPEGSAGCRISKRRVRIIMFYCNRHGLFTQKI